MARQIIQRGNFKGDHANADDFYSGAGKINDMTADIYAQLSTTLSAGDVRFAGYPTTEARIEAASIQAEAELKTILFIPASMIPYNGALVGPHPTLRRVREGGNWNTYDARAYGVPGWNNGSGRAPPEYALIADSRIVGGVEVIAHRGGLDFAPENTMAAFGAAAGWAHSLEFDVQFSSDGVPVVIHDATVNRTSNLTGNVKDLTIAALEAADFGGWFGARFTGTRIPRFRDVLKYGSQFAWLMYPEIKGYRTQADIALFVQEIIDLGLESRCIVTSFSSSDFAFARAVSDEIRFGFVPSDLTTFDALYPLAAADGSTIMFSDYNVFLANPSRVATARVDGVDVAAWTVATHDEVQQLVDLGVRRICSNKALHGPVGQ